MYRSGLKLLILENYDRPNSAQEQCRLRHLAIRFDRRSFLEKMNHSLFDIAKSFLFVEISVIASTQLTAYFE